MFNSKMTLQFKIDRQHITRLDNFIVTEKSNEYLYAHFVFSDDWNNLNKYILIRPLDIDAAYRLELDNTNTCKIPNILILFPGFVISARGEGNGTELVTLGDGICVDVELALIESGGDVPIAHIISSNGTINVTEQNDTVDLGIDLSFAYNQETSTLKLNANPLEGEPIELSSVVLPASVESIAAEDRYEEGGSVYYRNLVFTFTDGSVQRVSLDRFWNETRQSLNALSQRVAVIEGDYLTSVDKAELEQAIASVSGDISAHIADKNNPHEVTKAQVGLGNVDNTSDLNKPISTATQSALNLKADESELNSVSGRVSAIEQDYLTSTDKTALEEEISTVQGNLDTEITNREAADTTLQTNINSEATARQSADTILQTNITNEAGARQNADTALSNRITNIENAGYITQDINTSSIAVQYTKSTSKVSLVSTHEWHEYEGATEALLLSCAYGNGYYIAVGNNGVIVYSNDGQSWNLFGNMSNQPTIDKIVFGNGYFLAMSYTSRTIYKAYMPNGWTIQTTMEDTINPTNLLYVNNHFVLTGENGYIGFSQDGIKFKQLNTNISNIRINSVAYGNTVYLAVGDNGLLLYSKTGEVWNNITESQVDNYKNIIFYNGVFILNTNQSIRYSNDYYQFYDSIIPDLTTGGYNIQNMVAGESNFYVLATNNTNTLILNSANGQTFSTEYVANIAAYGIAYGKENFITVGTGNKVYNLNLHINWTYNKPVVSNTEYLWARDVNNLNNGDTLYSQAYFMGYVDKDTDELVNYYTIPTTDDLLDGKQDDMVAIESSNINNLFN